MKFRFGINIVHRILSAASVVAPTILSGVAGAGSNGIVVVSISSKIGPTINLFAKILTKK